MYTYIDRHALVAYLQNYVETMAVERQGQK